MTILQIAVLIALAILAGRLPKGRGLAMLGISAIAVFWLQPVEPYASLTFWLPLATLALAVLTWLLTAPPETRGWRQNWQGVVLLLAVIVLVDFSRHLYLEGLFALDTPPPVLVFAGILGFALAAWLLASLSPLLWMWRALLILAILLAFVVLKSPVLAHDLNAGVAQLRGTAPPANAIPLTWLGFSYLAFRLMHTVRDRQTGLLPPVSLVEYMDYAIFFPAFTAGPIDRVERFVQDLRSPCPLKAEDWMDAGTRLALGLFKKFVIADQLAVISINNLLVSEVRAGGWLWLFLYAYAFRIYFDFSGYTDIAIGMGRLMGVQLPENFSAPYLKPNLTQFWNSWHMSLTRWVRAYFFNPVTRAMRSARIKLPVWLVVLVAQISSMVLIGLWHGVTWGFVSWGLWHGVGLFLHNRWSELVKGRMPAWALSPRVQPILTGFGIFLTFNYVALGWLFFTLSTPAVAWLALRRLFGLA